MKNKPLPSGPVVKPASTEEALAFVRGLSKLRDDGSEPVAEARIQEYVSKYRLSELQGIARRIMMDVMTAPLSNGSQIRNGDSASPTGTDRPDAAAKKRRPAARPGKGKSRSPRPARDR